MDEIVANTPDVTLLAFGPAAPTIELASSELPLGALAVLHQAPDLHTASGALLPELASQLNALNVPLLQLAVNEHPDNAGTPALDVMLLERTKSDAETPTFDASPGHRPEWLDEVNANVAELLPRANSAEGIREAVLAVMSHPSLADMESVMRSFDRAAQGNTALAAPAPAGLVRLDDAGAIGAAQSVAARQAFLNPYLGAQHSLSNAHRKLAAAGVRPTAMASLLSVGAELEWTQDWQLAEMRLGLADAVGSLQLESLAEGATRGRGMHPAPVVWALGRTHDLSNRVEAAFRHPGDAILLLGDTHEELSGSVWELALHDNHLGGMPPQVRLDDEQRLAVTLVAAAEQGLLSSAIAVTDGGLAAALVQSALLNGQGLAVTLPDGDPTVELFSESAGRAVASLDGRKLPDFEALCREHGMPVARLGEVTGEAEVEFVGHCAIELQDIRVAGRFPTP